MIRDPYLSLDLVQLELALELFFFAMSVLVRKLQSTLQFIPNQCNLTCIQPISMFLGLQEMLLL
jgi:hypothetical protein